eukprot:1181448-Prorocentrum_minimum.AAC.2
MTKRAVEPLVQLLRTGDAEGNAQAVHALSDLAVNSDNQVSIVRVGAVEPLVQLLRTGDAEGKTRGSAGAEHPRIELRQPGCHCARRGGGAAGAAAAHWGRGGEDSGQRGR